TAAIGTRSARATLTGTRSARPVRSSLRVGCGRRSPPHSLVMHQSLDEAELNDRQCHDQDEEDDRFGARESELEVLEGVEIDAVDERARRVDRTASREEVDLRERLKDGDRVDNEEEEEGWRHQWDRDPCEHPRAPCAVESRGFVDLLRNPLKARE